MKTTQQSQAAEKTVADLLSQNGFEVIDRNWKTKVCEIDIVAEKAKIVYFIEVKYRSSEFQGDGFDYITDPKLKRMHFAAQVWTQNYNWNGDYRLMATSVSGPDCENIQIIELE